MPLHYGLLATCEKQESTFAIIKRTVCTAGLDPRDLKTALLCVSFLQKGEVLAHVGLHHNLKDLKQRDLNASHLHWRAGSSRSFAAIRKEAGGFCGSFPRNFLRKGELFTFIGRIQNGTLQQDYA